jgi:hypothetical protein
MVKAIAQPPDLVPERQVFFTSIQFGLCLQNANRLEHMQIQAVNTYLEIIDLIAVTICASEAEALSVFGLPFQAHVEFHHVDGGLDRHLQEVMEACLQAIFEQWIEIPPIGNAAIEAKGQFAFEFIGPCFPSLAQDFG